MKKYSQNKTHGLEGLGVDEIDREFWKKIKEENMIAQRSRNIVEQKRGIKDGKAKF